MDNYVVVYGYGTSSAYVFAVSPSWEIGLARLAAIRSLWGVYADKFSLHPMKTVVKGMRGDNIVLQKFAFTPSAPAPLSPKGMPTHGTMEKIKPSRSYSR